MILKKLSLYQKIVFLLLGLSVLGNLAAFFPGFCDAYTNTVYGLCSDLGGRITDLLPIALGELFLYAGALLVPVGLICAALLLLIKAPRFRGFVKKYLQALLLVFVIVLFLYTFHWMIPFRGRLLGGVPQQEVSFDEAHLRTLREFLVAQLNETATLVPRDENGEVRYPDDPTVRREIAESMQKLSSVYPRLSGYYPKLKHALCSEILEYMSIGGFTYPYTMELTCNRFVDRFYFPALFAHESAHHQGYYKENEANFLSYLACITSEDPVIRYSGYMDAYYYVDEAYRNFVPELSDAQKERYEEIRPSATVRKDKKLALKRAEEEFLAARHMQKLEEAAEKAADVGWKTQSDVLAANGYDGVVPLLLGYYKGVLYE